MRKKQKKRSFPKKIVFLIYFIALIIIAEIVLLVNPSPQKKSLQEYAMDVIKKCANSSFHPSCYDKEIPNLMNSISMEDAFEVAHIVQLNDSSYGYCHVLGHELAQRETAKDPAKWTDVIHRCPQGVCSNGCLHGAAQERFRNDVLTEQQIDAIKPQLMSVCDATPTWNPTGLEKSECYHGLGHLSMYITGAKIKKSMDVCDSIAYSKDGQDYRSLCYEGIFMQLFQPLEPEDIALVKGVGPTKKEDLRAFCEQFGDETKVEACWQEGWPIFRDEVATPQGTEDFCAKSSTPYARSHCFDMLFYVRAQGTNYDSEKLTDFCKGMPEGDVRGQCFGDMANAMIHGGLIHLDQAIAFCKSVQQYDTTGGCYQLMSQFADYNIAANSQSFIQLCNSLPNDMRQQCLAKKTATQ